MSDNLEVALALWAVGTAAFAGLAWASLVSEQDSPGGGDDARVQRLARAVLLAWAWPLLSAAWLAGVLRGVWRLSGWGGAADDDERGRP